MLPLNFTIGAIRPVRRNDKKSHKKEVRCAINQHFTLRRDMFYPWRTLKSPWRIGLNVMKKSQEKIVPDPLQLTAQSISRSSLLAPCFHLGVRVTSRNRLLILQGRASTRTFSYALIPTPPTKGWAGRKNRLFVLKVLCNTNQTKKNRIKNYWYLAELPLV